MTGLTNTLETQSGRGLPMNEQEDRSRSFCIENRFSKLPDRHSGQQRCNALYLTVQ